jgi:hypothetical protein
MQFILLRKHICGRTASIGADRPNKFPNLHNGIQHQLVQLNMKLAQNVYKYRKGQQVKPRSKKILKNNGFIRARHQHTLHTRRLAVPLGEIASVVLHQCDACFPNTGGTNVICYPSGCSSRRHPRTFLVIGSLLSEGTLFPQSLQTSSHNQQTLPHFVMM